MFSQIIQFIIQPIVWIPLVLILGFLTYRNYKKLNRLKVLNVDSVLLMLEIPRANDKKELAAEQLFASLHGSYATKPSFKTLMASKNILVLKSSQQVAKSVFTSGCQKSFKASLKVKFTHNILLYKFIKWMTTTLTTALNTP